MKMIIHWNWSPYWSYSVKLDQLWSSVTEEERLESSKPSANGEFEWMLFGNKVNSIQAVYEKWIEISVFSVLSRRITKFQFDSFTIVCEHGLNSMLE